MNAPYISTADLCGIFPQRWRANIVVNWPGLRDALIEQGLASDRQLVLYLLATISVESSCFTPAAEKTSLLSEKAASIASYGGLHGGSATIRPFGKYDDFRGTDKKGRFHLNHDLGNRPYRGPDDALMHSRFGDVAAVESEDGLNFRGRGFVQITGRYNYGQVTKAIGKQLHIDLVAQPDLVADPILAPRIAVAWIGCKATSIRRAVAIGLPQARKVINSAGLGTVEFSRLYKAGDKMLNDVLAWED